MATKRPVAHDAPYSTGDRHPLDPDLLSALRELRWQLDRVESAGAGELAEASAVPYAAGPPTRARIVRIGNSHGVRIPKPVLESTGLTGDVELRAADGCIVIRRAETPRRGWAAAFAEMAECGDDRLLDEEPLVGSAWDEEEWTW